MNKHHQALFCFTMWNQHPRRFTFKFRNTGDTCKGSRIFCVSAKVTFGFGFRDTRKLSARRRKWKDGKAPARENCFSFLLLLFKDIWKQRMTAARNFYAAFNVFPLHPLLQWFNKIQFVLWCRLCLLTPKSLKHGRKMHRHTRTWLTATAKCLFSCFFEMSTNSNTLLPASIDSLHDCFTKFPSAPTPPTLHYHFLRYAINSQFICK